MAKAGRQACLSTGCARSPEETSTPIGWHRPKRRGLSLAIDERGIDLHGQTSPDAVMEALGEELKPYLHGKATIRFRADKPLPAALVKRIVLVRIEENAARSNR